MWAIIIKVYIMFKSAWGRISYRFIEVFVVAGGYALVNDPEFVSLTGPALVALIVSLLKGLREARSRFSTE
jgi:hypothetical protein